MADVKNRTRRASAPSSDHGDGQTGDDPTGSKALTAGPSQVVDWAGLNQSTLDAEKSEGGHGRRVVRVWHTDAKTDVWIGSFGSAPVEVGVPAYQFSDGEIVNL
jgi:hypothetical protein